MRGQGWLGDSRSGWGAPARTKVQPGGPGRPVALASAVTLRLRFPSSEGPLGSKGLVFSASGARAWGLGGAPATRPSLAGTRRWPGPPPRAPEQHKGGARPTHPTAGFPGWGPRAGPWSWALEAAAVPGRGHSSAFPAPPQVPSGLWNGNTVGVPHHVLSKGRMTRRYASHVSSPSPRPLDVG